MYDIVIIGGGFAGAVALRESVRLGHRCLLLEARDRLGGRAWLKPDALAGQALEMGCQFFQRDYAFINAEIVRYGVPFSVYQGGLDGTHWIRQDGTVHQGGPPLAPSSLPILEDLVVDLRGLAERIDLERPWSEQFPGPDGERWDISVDHWLVQHRAPDDVREVASLALSPWLVTPGPQRSLLYLARMVAADGGLYRYLAGENLILRNGTTDLVQRIVDDAGAEVRLRSPVARIEQDDEGIRVHTPDGVVTARAVICAAPLSVLPDIEFEPALDARRVEAGMARRGGEGSKVWAAVHGVPEHFWAFGPLPGLHSAARVGDLDDGSALVVAFGTTDPWISGTDTSVVQSELRRWFPNAVVTASTGHDWLDDPWTRNCGPFPRPGDSTLLDAVLSRPEGRVLFAGSESSLRRPGFVDGAIETGFRAAREADALLTREKAA